MALNNVLARSLLAVACLTLFCTGLVQAEPEESRFQRTARALQTAEPELRAKFAQVALLELAEVFLAEADLARKQSEASIDAVKLATWSRAVDQYAHGLILLLEDINSGLEVEIRLNDREVPTIRVAGRAVMLAHPRSDQQPGYEQTVLTQFCTGARCTGLTAQEEDRQAIPMSPSLVTPEWDFRIEGPLCRHSGLQVAFAPGGKLAMQKALCQQFMQEVELMATELAWQQRHGVAIDWAAIQIRSIAGRPEHLVILNSAEDSLLISLPLMQSSPALLPQLTPWLRQRFADSAPPVLEIDAGEQGWD